MLRRILSAAFAAGIAVGLIITAIQHFTLLPLIKDAELYESGEKTASTDRLDRQTVVAFADTLARKVDGVMPRGVAPIRLFLAHGSAAGEGETADGHDHGGGSATWEPKDGLERTLYTTGANIVTAIGFALLLAAAMALKGDEVDGRTGVLWGIGGFAAFTLAPALGLPPEAPGQFAAALYARQVWWIGTAAATIAGLSLTVFAKRLPFIVFGLFLIALPHAIGAPQPEGVGGMIPPEIAARFSAASIVISGVFWAMLGWTTGALYKRFGKPDF